MVFFAEWDIFYFFCLPLCTKTPLSFGRSMCFSVR
ncbi:hypothetical protein LINGRAHAP2_LOCUS18002 [Linum grandiflorum]